jgi:hypothetical protein
VQGYFYDGVVKIHCHQQIEQWMVNTALLCGTNLNSPSSMKTKIR